MTAFKHGKYYTRIYRIYNDKECLFGKSRNSMYD